METRIKEYWNNLISAYAEKYNEPIFKNYETSKIFVEKFEEYLNELLEKHPNNVDIVCALATTLQELRFEDKAIKLLEDFIKNHESELNHKDNARLYTNLAFYNAGDSEELKFLLEAQEYNSPYVQTYEGLALNYFSKYQHGDKTTIDLEKSFDAFKKALELNNTFELTFGYGVCLFGLQQYEKAKAIFETLLEKYPNRMRLVLCIAYCEVYLGNKDKALCYLKQIKSGQDEQYAKHNLSIDDIGVFEILDAYYVLEEYNLFLEESEKVIAQYYFDDGDYYYYSLWITKQHDVFHQKIETQKQTILSWIEETKVDEDFQNEEERQEYIESYKEDLEKLILMENRIKNENYKPIVKLELYPQYGCYLVDCIRHNF